jgi:hypothetical protein
MGEDPARAAKGSSPINFAALKLDGLTSTLDYALAYAATGMAICPTTSRRVPLTEHGYLDATTDPAVIRAWWERWPAAEIAWSPPIEIVVLDLDEKNGDHGLRDFVELAGTSADDVTTPQACSPTGGRHLVYLNDGRCFRNRRVIPGRGIETKTRGGLVHLPAHQNGRRWLKSLATTPIAMIPSWVPEAQDMGSGSERPYAGSSDFEISIVAKACAEIENAPPGEQEQTLFKWCSTIGGLVAGGAVDEGPAQEALTQAAWAMPSYNPSWPWDHNKLRDKVEASIAKGKKRPLDAPEEILEIGDQEQRAADYEATNPFGDETAASQDPDRAVAEAEAELAEYTRKVREARDQNYRNALSYNAGKRLARLAKAGYLKPERVLKEIDAAIESWGQDHD